jgi:tRNA(Ile)-lysidine synthase
MLEQVSSFIRDRQLASPHHRLLAAVSGGPDSVVLCEVLSRLEFDFAIAHCHFGLRAEESDADEIFVKKLAKKHKVPFFSEQFQTQAFAEEQKVSVQMAARTLRYAWFEQIRRQHGYDAIATAHHRTDTAETVLFNLTKGTGIAGLHGIPARNGHVIRPLLCLTKDDILTYLKEHQLDWREDSSNESTKYQRNLIRREVIPVLKQINPNFENTLQHTVAKIQGVEDVLQAYVEQARQKALKQENGVSYLDIASLQSLKGLPVVLHELLRPYHFSYGVAEEIISSFAGPSGKTFSSPSHVLVKDRGQLVLTPRNLAGHGTYSLPAGQATLAAERFRLYLRQVPAEGYRFPASPHVAALDLDLLQFPLQVRKWRQGDWFVPLGMTGKKKLSDFLIDRKVPLNVKEQVMVLISGQAIAWVVGYRPDNRFKITEKTRQVLEIRHEWIKKEEDRNH